MQVLYTRFPSLSVYTVKADIYLHIHVFIYILMAPVEVLTHPLSSPFASPHLSCFPLSFPHFLAAVLSVERVINRATRWCCNTFWKHYRVPALCAVMQENRRGPLISTTPATWLRARNLQFLHYRDRGIMEQKVTRATCLDLSRVAIFSQSRRNYKNKPLKATAGKKPLWAQLPHDHSYL